MAVKDILMIGNELLRKKAEDVDFMNDPVEQYIQDLQDTLRHARQANKIGRAIAGPQIGYFKKIIYVETLEKTATMINPRITQKSREKFEVWDSCFSADVTFFGKTLRHTAITVTYTDENQQAIREDVTDDLSELFQHEIDHLNGILFTDHILNNQIIMRSEWEKCQSLITK